MSLPANPTSRSAAVIVSRIDHGVCVLATLRRGEVADAVRVCRQLSRAQLHARRAADASNTVCVLHSISFPVDAEWHVSPQVGQCECSVAVSLAEAGPDLIEELLEDLTRNVCTVATYPQLNGGFLWMNITIMPISNISFKISIIF